MASDAVAPKRSPSSGQGSIELSKSSIMDDAKGVLSSFASLKLTVTLFFMSLFLVWVGTLAQAEISLLDSVSGYFRSWYVWIPFRVLIPSHWHPSLHAWLDHGIGTDSFALKGFVYPGGWLLGALLLVNLTSAHLVRFQIRGKGKQLVAGWTIIVTGLVLTAFIVANGNLKDGIQDKPFLSWNSLWLSVLFGIALLWCAALYGLVTLPWERLIEKALLVIAITLLSICIGWVIYTGNRLEDAALRILWQLIQGMAAGLVLLVGCYYVFGKRFGIVLLHFGVGLMMLNELWVGLYAVEEQIFIIEGDRTDIAIDVGKVEIAVVDRSLDDEDVETSIPISRLKEGSAISDEQLPFDVRLDKYFRNSDLQQRSAPTAETGFEDPEGNGIEVTLGQGRFFEVISRKPFSGANEDRDAASAYVTLLDKSNGEPIGTCLLSQQYGPNRISDEVDVTHDGKTYAVSLRFKHNYKPYYLKLKDVGRKNYIGSDTAKSYWSEFDLISKETDEPLSAKISMNNPLRYAGETFYQSGYHPLGDGIEASTIQIVTNEGWTLPYIGCMFVAVAMLAHFSSILFRFLKRKDLELGQLNQMGAAVELPTPEQVARETSPKERRKKPTPPKELKRISAKQLQKAQGGWASYIVPVVVVGIFGLYAASKMVPRSSPQGEMNLEAIANIPIVNGGRQLPLDSFARQTLSSFNQKESFQNDKDEAKEPAIRWLADLISGREQARDDKIFYVTHPNMIGVLGLKKIKEKRYSYNEINAKRDKLKEQFEAAMSVSEDKRQPIQAAYLKLEGNLQLFERLDILFTLPRGWPNDNESFISLKDRIDFADKVAEFKSGLPLATPAPDDEDLEAWETFAVASTRQWILELAKVNNLDSTSALVDKWWTELVPNEQEFMSQMVIERLSQELQAEILAENPTFGEEEIKAELRERLTDLPSLESRLLTLRSEITQTLEMQKLRTKQALQTSIDKLLGEGGINQKDNEPILMLASILESYRDEKVADANNELKAYHQYLEKDAGERVNLSKISTEVFYNEASPLTLAWIIYLIGGLVGIVSWMAWPKTLRRTAFWLIVLGLLLHTFALLLRIYISGRAPVTSLYSSILFVGWASVLFFLIFEFLFRMGIGNFLAAAGGCFVLYLAPGFAVGQDSFSVMVAVLDTQFWLWTHVTTISLGYTTAFVAGALGLLFIVGSAFTPAFDKQKRKDLYGMMYGAICFSILFSFVGTVLGGLWADDSWGRFWGWDPKENGALMIVIWNALILHARWGGMVRDRGFAVLCVGGNVITAWSWFAVNQLGIGLHSYGFTEGILYNLLIWWAFNLVVMALGIFLPMQYWWSIRSDDDSNNQPPTQPKMA